MNRWINAVLFICASLILWGCDNTDKNLSQKIDNSQNQIVIELDDTPTDTENNKEDINPSSSTEISTDSRVFTPDNNLLKNYQNKPFSIIDSSEVMLDGASTLIVTFSVPLNLKQNFNELVSLVEEGKGKVDGNWELSNNGLELRHRYLAPNCQLKLHIDKALVAINGKSLKSDYQTSLVTRNRPAMVGFSSNGSLLPSTSMKGLPITTLNVDQVDINFFRIKTEKIYEFMQNYGTTKQLSIESSAQVLSYTDLIYSARFNLSPKLNVQENKIIDLSMINELKGEGTYIAVLNQAGQYNYSNPMTIFSISNIGLSVHAYQNGKLSIFAHRLDDGSALANIKITALCAKKNNKCKTLMTETDQQGYAELATDRNVQYQMLTASDGEQMSFVYLAHNALDLSEFDVLGSPYYQKQLFTFATRDLYRPGETIYLNALLRDADGQILPIQPINTEIVSPSGQIIKSFVWQAAQSSNGFYQTEFTIPVNAATGKWTVKFNLGDDVYRYYYFSVEEFLPERVLVTLAPISDKPILNNQNADFIIKGWYLYGMPAAGNEQQTKIAMMKERNIAKLPDFYIGSITESNLDKKIETIEQLLDSQGIAKISIDKQNWDSVKSPIKLALQTSVLDVGGRPVMRTITQSIWPAEHIPAIRPLFAENRNYDWSSNQYVKTPTVDFGSSADFEVAYIDKDGNKYRSNKLTARLIKERRDYYWTWSDTEGWQAQYDQKELVLSEQNVKISEDRTAKVSFSPDDYGLYRIEVIDNNTNVISSLRFGYGYLWSDNTEHRGTVRPDQVKLTLDKVSYKVGDIAKVHVEAPVSGSGYISLEANSGTLWMKKINVSQNGVDIDIPIKDWGRHDIYINAMIIRPTTDSAVRTVKRAVGLLYLPINTSDRQLKLMLDVVDKSYSENSIKVKVKVNNEKVKNSPMTVLMSAVDNSVLNITGFITPDPYSFFLGRKRYDVEQFDVYGKLIEGNGSLVSMNFGGDNDTSANQNILSGGKRPLTTVNIVAQQLKTITLNSLGEGEIELAIPNFNGELKLMAQVWDNNRFGYAEKVVTVAEPIVAELSPPHFLSGGDQTSTALELRNLTDLPQNITLALSTDGLIAVVNKDIPSEITLNPQEQKILTIPIVANEGEGNGRITINVGNVRVIDNPHYQLSRTWTIGVRPAYKAISRVSSATLNGGEGWSLSPAALTDLIDNTIEAELVFSHNLTFNIAKYIKALHNYQSGSLEQTISRLYPFVYTNQEQLQELSIQSISDAERHKYIQTEIDRIFGMQRINGSFGLWNRECTEEYWLTVYAVDFLLRAQERGYRVNQQGLNKALDRIGQYLYEPAAFYNLTTDYDNDIEDYIVFSTKSYAALILAKQKKITPAMRNELKRLYQLVKGNSNAVLLSPLPIMQLSIASKLTGNSRTSQDLFDIALSLPRDSHYNWLGDYGSAIRDKVQIYNLMVEYHLADELQVDYLTMLSDMLKNKRYFSTQELSTLFIMSWENIQNQQDEDKLVVLLNNKERLQSTGNMHKTLDYKQLTNGITVHNPYNALPLHLQFSLSGYTKTAPKPTPINGVLSISRQYFDTKGKPITPDQLHVGDMIIVMLDVSADRVINDALVVDMLPAGLELENPNLVNNCINLQAMPELAELLKEQHSNDIKYQEFRDDRYIAAIAIHNRTIENRYSKKLIYLASAVSVGQYRVPAPYVESMYSTQWYAIGDSIPLMTINPKKE